MPIRQTRVKCTGLALAILIANCFATSAIAQSAATLDSELAATHPWSSPEYIDWLERRSMLKQSEVLAPRVSGKGGAVATPIRRTTTARGDPAGFSLAVGISRIGHHATGRISHRDMGRSTIVGSSRGHRHHSITYRAGEYHRGNRRTRIHVDD